MRNFIPIIILGLALALCVPVFAQTQGVVYPNGRGEVVVPSGQYVNVFTSGAGLAKVFKQVGGPPNNVPSAFSLETTNSGVVQNEEVVFGPYTNGTTLRIFAFADNVYWSLGALAAIVPVVKAGPAIETRAQLAPVAQTTTVTLLATDLASGIVTATQSSGGTIAYTLPTGTLTDAALNLRVNESIQWYLINLSSSAANTITLTAGAGHTIVGNAVLGVATSAIPGSATFLTRKTAANTFVTYRLN